MFGSRIVRTVLIAAIVVLAGLLAVLTSKLWSGGGLEPIAGIGGPFSLVDHRGNAVTEETYIGKPTLVFFGFTHCPDVCPTTLLGLTNLLAALKTDAERLNVLYVTVDPNRDTPQKMADYLTAFDPRIIGLSGTDEQIADIMKVYRVYARKVPLSGDDYTMDHTATVYMMNSKGQFVGQMSYQEDETVSLAKLKRLLGS